MAMELTLGYTEVILVGGFDETENPATFTYIAKELQHSALQRSYDKQYPHFHDNGQWGNDDEKFEAMRL
jgi:hypothetical protein